jgi:hypothetical protein
MGFAKGMVESEELAVIGDFDERYLARRQA